MKGILFNVVARAVILDFGEDAWDDVLESCGLAGAYTSLGNYDDDELVSIVDALPSACGADVTERLRWFGRHAIPQLVELFPDFFEGSSLETFLPALNHMIHPEVRKLYPGATPPDFDIDHGDGGSLLLRYQSERTLCWLAEGFVHGAARHFGESVTIDQPSCTHLGDEACVLRIRFAASEKS